MNFYNKNKKNKKEVVAIAGSMGQIGLSLAKELIDKNYSLLLGDINKKKLNSFKKKYKNSDIQIYCGNLCETSQIEKFIKFGLKKFGKIDSAVHCSYPKSSQWGKKFENLQDKNIKEDLYNQLGSVIIFCQKIIEIFIKFKKGNLILFSSIYGFKTPRFEIYKGTKINTPIEYAAIKAGIINITFYLAKYFKKKNIRVNCVSPGGILSNQNKIFIKNYKQECNSKGLLDGEDVSNLIVFLLSENSKHIHGQNLVIDDGWSL
jgi:NAD(P)-dependent dehydrogenase (short-subunit alcohol dehydrogenase family)